MKELVDTLVRALVETPEEVDVQQIDGERTTIYEVRVAPDDLGRVIGKHGRIANALRTVVRTAAIKDGRRVSVEILA
ncbi:MAG: RNA-binding protein [Armatimonadetes bacterium CG2_30_59_28]|nr:MAG: RNA-binding protein [Armatimonadetes bacterium CG2_30_59_28]PIU65308.1 MAG: RNA-binding protein [Armatimonadetes bacterium CG07_land_8_20_14_0_80_59_28]PIX42692.1 MAG: RNA-binding protein [Armatimonadetes bacterium CG_4_8_14_3_um_filter_58_9]PIY40662.1 MAG: RNA-binding protein [Armatimonadetes bacterium CG_4_10_14_3_um_filter_59_10]PJB78162.1 MAG: RNA-binding protein [Armatimonadetes bacterium CG_4_9_14_3_um_filter_58_7]